MKLDFRILKQQWNARVWEFLLNDVTVQTPCFMPVGTKATVKGLLLDMLRDPKYLGTQSPFKLILWNTYHLYLRPGEQLIKKAGGLHTFMHREDGLILTDSGWFQVFSLWLWDKTKGGKSLVKLMDHWVEFRSIHDGSKHMFTPSGVVDIQTDLGSDIMMMLDVCSPVDNITKDEVARQMSITHKWAQQAYEYFKPRYEDARWVLFPIVQWWLYDDLRAQSAQTLSAYATDGIAIWWLSVWETKSEMKRVLEHTLPHLPKDKPRYLMGVGTPKDIEMAIWQGVDMFDCVLPTRLGRHGTAFGPHWQIKLSNAQYREDFSPLTDTCQCHTCTHYTRAYLHHLVRENEMLWGTLLSLHNIAYLHKQLEDWRNDILAS